MPLFEVGDLSLDIYIYIYAHEFFVYARICKFKLEGTAFPHSRIVLRPSWLNW